jgi:trans-aconitate 2-methyltransferase
VPEADTWDPDQYKRFQVERDQPFLDLLDLVEPVDAPTVADLGCGDGRLTATAHRRHAATTTLGIDSSASMLAEAPRVDGLRFDLDDISTWAAPRSYDVIIANASLQWVPDHAAVLARWIGSLAGGGQLAVQVPSNADHRSHTLVAEVAEEVGIDAPPDPVAANVLTPVAYAELLDGLGAYRQSVRLQVYAHRLASTPEVVEWVKGTTLNRVRQVTDEPTYARFVDCYRERLVAALGDQAPYTYLFKRIVLWARFP